MIWVAGQIVRDDELSVSVLDRTFEHGLGLFETFRTWNGHATLLPRHLERMKGAAADLGLPIPEPWQLPTEEDVQALLAADGRAGDAMLRITMSGGVAGSPTGALVWMRSAELPAEKPGGYVIEATWKVRSEPTYGENVRGLGHYKSLNYWERRNVYEGARSAGLDENLAIDEHGWIYEGSRTNVFVVIHGRLSTPFLNGRIVPGIMRQVVLDFAEQVGISPIESDLEGLNRDTFQEADEVFLTNSVRGVIPVAEFRFEFGDEQIYVPSWSKAYPAPGPRTIQLWDLIRPWLESGGERPR